MLAPEVFRVGDGIWCVRRPSRRVCSYVVETDPGAVVVDAGMLDSGADPMMALQRARVGLASVRGIILTHGHAEHAAGAAALKARSGCPLFYSAAEASRMSDPRVPRGVTGWIARRLPEEGALSVVSSLIEPVPPRPVEADHHPVDGELLLDAFRVISTPGHTQGHLAFFHEPSGALFCGDALSVVGGELRFAARGSRPPGGAARKLLKSLIELDVRLILPGRQSPLTEGVVVQAKALLLSLSDRRSG